MSWLGITVLSLSFSEKSRLRTGVASTVKVEALTLAGSLLPACEAAATSAPSVNVVPSFNGELTVSENVIVQLLAAAMLIGVMEPMVSVPELNEEFGVGPQFA